MGQKNESHTMSPCHPACCPSSHTRMSIQASLSTQQELAGPQDSGFPTWTPFFIFLISSAPFTLDQTDAGLLTGHALL